MESQLSQLSGPVPGMSLALQALHVSIACSMPSEYSVHDLLQRGVMSVATAKIAVMVQTGTGFKKEDCYGRGTVACSRGFDDLMIDFAGWWFGCHQFHFPRNIGFRSSSQLTNSYFSEGWPKTTNQL